MNPCLCKRLYRMSTPTATTEYAFSGSLCRICEFETADGLRYCLTIFSLDDYKHLHFPHDEYKCLMSKLYALLSTQTIIASASNSDVLKSNFNALSINQLPFDDDFKIKFGGVCLNIGPVTAFGLVNTSPYESVDVFSLAKKHFVCDPKWDICTCAMCPVFKRLIDYEAAARMIFPDRNPQNVIES